MGDKEWTPENVLDVFGDSLARRILVIASERPVSAEELSENLDVSPPTVYRRLNALSEHDLLREDQQIDGDGNHYTAYETTLDRVAFEIEDGEYAIDVQLRQGLVEGFEAFWSDLDRSRAGIDLDVEDNPTGTTGDTNHG
jgi:DNA-binding transcriptional ArsR family regulator